MLVVDDVCEVSMRFYGKFLGKGNSSQPSLGSQENGNFQSGRNG